MDFRGGRGCSFDFEQLCLMAHITPQFAKGSRPRPMMSLQVFVLIAGTTLQSNLQVNTYEDLSSHDVQPMIQLLNHLNYTFYLNFYSFLLGLIDLRSPLT